MAQVDKKLLEDFTYSQLESIVDEFFNERFWFDFYQEVISEEKIENPKEFAKEYFIDQISDNVTKDELVEHGWLCDDEGEEDDWVNNQIDY